ncbi:hypothetical protein AB0D94_25880 [Streptomyces sp. NPDC048255]|uniref:hypothetical protein n=1 Tax=Streptomyces sp. NPDC048255 TaxID=3154713 RepID=UPI00340D7125
MKRYLKLAAAAMVTAAMAGCGGSGGSVSSPMNGPGQAPVPAGPYRLEMPKEVLKGTYKESDHSAPDQNIPVMLSGQIEHGVSAFAAYQPTGSTSDTGPVLAVTGVYGTVLNPVTARDEFLKILDRRTSVPDRRSTVITGPRAIIPQGSSEPVSCRVVRRADQFGTVWEPDCAWADGSAVVHVSHTVYFEKPSADFDLEALAAKTAIIRNEVRVAVAP